MTILALDLATTTGWAHSGPPITSGTIFFKGSRHEGGGMRFLRFRQWLCQMLDILGGVQAVYYEEVRRHLSTDAAHIHGGLLAVLQAECELRRIPYAGIPVGTIKKHTTGKGNATKADIIAAIIERGHRPADDNEADALALLYTAKETL